MKKPIGFRGVKPGSIKSRDELEMEGTRIWRDARDKYMNYYRGILPFFGSFGRSCVVPWLPSGLKKSID